jgi:hypothetical protein
MRLLLTAFLASCLLTTFGQQVQSISGRIIDRDSRSPLAGATIAVADTTISALSNASGNFILNHVPTGRQRLIITFVGYETVTTDQIIVGAGKQLDLLIEMTEEKKQLTTISITAPRNSKLPVNKFAQVSGRSFSAEETQRFVATANDPSRMVVGFPGVQATRDTRSDIIIRGNNPVGMQWRLEGLDIPNPNHFARKGSSGGGITIFSLAMLDNSDFFTGALPAEYGDVLSGAFDMRFRKGNNQKNEYTFKAGLIGLEFAAEGPFTKGQSSFLVNYRYSTLGLLNAMGLNLVGERENNNFQDLSFNLAFQNKKKTVQTNFWGIAGYSKETYDEIENPADWKQYDDYAIYDFRTYMSAVGLAQTIKLNQQSFLKTSLAVMGQKITFRDDTLNINKQATIVNDETYSNNRIAATINYNNKFSAAANMKAGVYASLLNYSLNQGQWDYINNRFRPDIIDGNGSTLLLQPYVQFSLKPGTKWVINPGFHAMYLALNGTAAVDPRLSIQYKASVKSNFTVAYGLHSKILPLGSYFYKGAGSTYPNKDLKMMRSHHFIAAWDQLLGKNWKLHVEMYRQNLFNIPVVNDPNRTFWLLNELEGYAKEPLVSQGKGTNTGIDFSIEKFFSKGFFTLLSFSLFESNFQPLNGKSYNTRFNSGSSGSWVGTREWKLRNNKTLQAGWKMVYNGGLPLSPLAAQQPFGSREPLLDETNPYSVRIPGYFRTDGRIALRKDKKQLSWQLALDIQNVFMQRNTDGLSRRFDPSVNQWIFRQQSGIVPVLSYQVDF